MYRRAFVSFHILFLNSIRFNEFSSLDIRTDGKKYVKCKQMLQNQDLDEICIHVFCYGIVTKNNTTADINDLEFILKSWTVLKVSKT